MICCANGLNPNWTDTFVEIVTCVCFAQIVPSLVSICLCICYVCVEFHYHRTNSIEIDSVLWFVGIELNSDFRLLCDDLVSYELTWQKHFVFFNCFVVFDMESIALTVCTYSQSKTSTSSAFFCTCREYFCSDSIYKFTVRCYVICVLYFR